MGRTSRITTLAAALACGLPFFAPPAASATVSLAIDGPTIAVTGSAAKDTVRVLYENPADGASPGYTVIIDLGGISEPLPPGCFGTSSFNDNWSRVKCQDGGTAPFLTDLTMAVGSGGDELSLEACFDTTRIDAGDGQNDIKVVGCAGGEVGIIGGADFDTLRLDDSGRSLAGPQMKLTADLGADLDSFYGGFATSLVRGGPGNDDLDGGDGDEQLFGEDGTDFIQGRGGNDALDGGAGDDELGRCKCSKNDTDPGADDYRGGAGADRLYLDAHPAAMSISINEAADDGAAGEGDNVHNDIERIDGTFFADTFTGGPGTDTFNGSVGNDTIAGGGGADVLDGESGNDRVKGDAGADQVIGGRDHDVVDGDAGDDRVIGGFGDDVVDGGAGVDALFGDLTDCGQVNCPFGSDRLFARDGERDTVQCGGGADTAQVDALDAVALCQDVDRQGPAATTTTPGTTTTTPETTTTTPETTTTTTPETTTTTTGTTTTPRATVALTGRASVAKGLGVKVTCPAACTFTVTVRLDAATARRYRLGRQALTIGTARGRLQAAGSSTLKVTLTKRARRRLRRAKKPAAVLRLSVKDAAGAATTATRAIALAR